MFNNDIDDDDDEELLCLVCKIGNSGVTFSKAEPFLDNIKFSGGYLNVNEFLRSFNFNGITSNFTNDEFFGSVFIVSCIDICFDDD